jgi:hypothetical protein
MKVLSVFTVLLGALSVSFGGRDAMAQSNVTSGSVALLAEPKDTADTSALREALGHSDPAVRAVAARVAGLLDRKDLSSALLELLAREQDAMAAREQVRAVLYLRGVEMFPHAKAAAARLGETGRFDTRRVARPQPPGAVCVGDRGIDARSSRVRHRDVRAYRGDGHPADTVGARPRHHGFRRHRYPTGVARAPRFSRCRRGR